MRIEITTPIAAPALRCFDLARDIDLHVTSMHDTGERAVEGKTSGMIGMGEQVTWEGQHFGIRQRFTSRIVRFDPPARFDDEMILGAFKRFIHEHHFQQTDHGCVMRDVVEFEAPGWILGRVFDRLILARYLRNLLRKRAQVIKQTSETIR